MIKYLFWTFLFSINILVLDQVKAFCPACTVVVAAGVGLSRWLKIDDTISGLWIGGLIVALIGWTISWCERKKIAFWGRNFFITIAYYTIVIWPLYQYEILGHPLNRLWGMDRLFLGILTGSAFFLASYLWYVYLKKKRGKPHFPYQKIVMPLVPLIVLSIVFYLLTRY